MCHRTSSCHVYVDGGQFPVRQQFPLLVGIFSTFSNVLFANVVVVVTRRHWSRHSADLIEYLLAFLPRGWTLLSKHVRLTTSFLVRKRQGTAMSVSENRSNRRRD